jgi:cellulose synthase/poly-beta-1,6-N-acetylglucosamine synthase-like glycosyltransferase
MPWDGWLDTPEWFAALAEVWFVLGGVYVVALQLTMAGLSLGAHLHLRNFSSTLRPGRLHMLHASSATPGVSVVVPAHNEGPVVVPTVQALLASDYVNLEVIVVDDGSTDDTLESLVEAFHLAPVLPDSDPETRLPSGRVRGEWRALGEPRLRVISKDCMGSKADAANAGLNYATQPLLVVLDGDGLLDRRAISLVVASFLEGGDAVVAAGGTILPINDCTVEGATVTEARTPRGFIPACQLLEYLRAFVIGRTGLSQVGAVTLVSGAFGLFRTDAVRALGGYTAGHLGEDLDITLRLLRAAIDADPGARPRVLQVPEAILWTEVPSTWSDLRGQRIRWHRGLIQALSGNRDMIFRRRWHAIGLVGMPQLFVFEFLAPLVQGAGLVATVVLLVIGSFNLWLNFTLLSAVIAAGLLVTVTALWAEERNLKRYASTAGLVRLLVISLFEQLLYLPVTAIWRMQATFMKGPGVWGEMSRIGFGSNEPTTVARPAEQPASPSKSR